MFNIIEELKHWFKQVRKDQDRYTLSYYLGESIRIPYSEVEKIVETIESLEQSCDDIIKANAMLEDYNRLLRKENDELKQAKVEQ